MKRISTMVRIHDGCVKVKYEDPLTGRVYTQRKRRRTGVELDECTWVVHCDDHPHGYRLRPRPVNEIADHIDSWNEMLANVLREGTDDEVREQCDYLLDRMTDWANELRRS